MDFLLAYISVQESGAGEINLVLSLTAMQIWLWEGFSYPHGSNTWSVFSQ